MISMPDNLQVDSAVEAFQRLPIIDEWSVKPLKLKDRSLYDKFVSASEFPIDIWSSNFAYLWAHTRIRGKLVILRSRVEGMLVTWILTTKGRLYLPCLPVGPGSPEHVISVLQRCNELCAEWNRLSNYADKAIVAKLSSNQLDFFQKFEGFNQSFLAKKLTGLEHHLSISNLTKLSGKKFSTIRYKVNKFTRDNPSVKLRSYQDNDFDKVVSLGLQWKETSGTKHRRILDSFYFKATIKNHRALGLETLIVEVDDKIVGVTTGGALPNGQAWGYITKFNKNYDGISEYMVVAMAKRINELDPNIELINIGTDFGNKQLAMAKEKFRPVNRYQRYALLSR